MIAQNLDMPGFYDGYQVILHIKHHDSDLESFVYTIAGVIGANGMNSHAIGICCNTLLQLDNCRDGLQSRASLGASWPRKPRMARSSFFMK